MNQALNSFDDPWPDLNGKSVMVTGGTGSFGQAFVRMVLDNYEPARLVVFSRDEMKQYEMAQGQDGDRYSCMRYFIGDVRDVDRLEMAMRGVDIIIHAAAPSTWSRTSRPESRSRPGICVRSGRATVSRPSIYPRCWDAGRDRT